VFLTTNVTLWPDEYARPAEPLPPSGVTVTEYVKQPV